MFFHHDIKGDDLPPQTICLTYDDGPGESPEGDPGPHTAQLGRYLFEQEIQATFFVIGRHAERYPDTLKRLRDWGHLIGNHTYSHPGLVALAESGGDVAGEISRTDEVIRPFLSGDISLFRPPYGNWRQKVQPGSPQEKTTSIVADILNRSSAIRHYTGPVKWDISADDFDFWKRQLPAEPCAHRYLELIDQKGQGIVLMHDSSEDEAVRAHNGTLHLTQLLVPTLKAKGYRFVGLNRVPQVKSAIRTSLEPLARTF